MLCDDIVANGVPGSGMDIAPIIPRIKRAQKFVLGPDFAAVADALSSDYTGLVRAFPQCRLPFSEVWIELAAADRPQFMAAPLHIEALQVPPRRIGFLLTATRDDLSAWRAHLLWSTARTYSCPALAVDFDMQTTLHNASVLSREQDEAMYRAKWRILDMHKVPIHPGWVNAADSVRNAIMQHTNPVLPDYTILPPALDFSRAQLDQYADLMAELARSDWAGETGYILAVIGLLNARNVVELKSLESVDLHKLNRARIKRGKPPLFEHKILRIMQRRMTQPGDSRPGDYAKMRGHFVRGHFKTRRSGVYFWHPHARGDFKRGYIDKEYHL